MNSCSNSLAACKRNQSLSRRWISGSGTRRRSTRGGKRPAWPTAPAYLLPLLPFLPNQEAVGQHDQHTVAVETGPQPPLILIPAQQPFRLLVVLLHPVPPVRVADRRRQRRPRPQVAPIILAVGRGLPAGLFADQPTRPALAVRGHPPAAQGHEPSR